MISDHQMLGIDEDADLATVKSAFRRRAKELHPDLSSDNDAIPRHDLFIAVCKAYQRLRDVAESDETKLISPMPEPDSSDSVIRHSDQAYVFYRQGMKWFMAIHPSHWILDPGGMLNTPIAGHEESHEESKRKVMELVRLFPKAYYYFSIVAHDYPDSPWAYDSREKMGKIEDRLVMYRRIIESFSTWNKDKMEMIREYQETYGKMNKNLKAVRRDMPKDWR